MNELANKFIDAEAVFSGEINLVNERLSSTDSHLEMIEIVEIFLYYLVSKSKYGIRLVDKVSQYLLQHPKNANLDWLATEACLSRKKFTGSSWKEWE